MARTYDARGTHWSLWIFGGIVALVGLALLAGGIWLAMLGGSWYYLLAGLGLLIAGVQLVRGSLSGAWWYAAVFVGTVLWTIWESGLDYWGWVPRMGLLVIFAFVLALLLPRLGRASATPVSGALWKGLAIAFAVIFVAVFALAFAPHDVTGATRVAAAPAGAAVPATTATVMQPADAPAPGDWAAYGRSNAALRYSPLAQIDRSNVGQLKRAWVYRTGDLPKDRWGAETTPLKIGDTVYLCTARNILIALDARTGKQRWRYDPKVPDEYIPYTAACRGVAYYSVPATPPAGPAPAASVASASSVVVAGGVAVVHALGATTPTACRTRIIEGTLDARLIAVDANTGQPCAGFGNDGQVDITRSMGKHSPAMVSITSAPTIVRGVIVTGHQVLDGQRLDAPSGVIQGFDAVTGKLDWAWDMGHPERNGLPPPGQTYSRGTPNMWTTATGDEALGLVYLPMGNAAVDYISATRTPIENTYASSVVALDVTTGKPAWHFQTVHKDVWDYDLGSQPSLVDFPTAAGTVPALLLPTKNGDMYVLDRRTGKPLTGVEQRPVPQGGLEPDQRAPTQPFSLYATLRQPKLTPADMWGMTPIDQMACRIQFAQASYQGIYTPPTAKQPWVEYTGYNGGSDWGSVAVDPRRGVIVANYNDMPNYNHLVPRAKANKLGWVPRDETKDNAGPPKGAGDPQQGAAYAVSVNAGWRLAGTGLLCKEPPYGRIRAIDLATGKTLWDRPFGTARANGPWGIHSHLPIHIGTPNNGGAVITAGGLVFIAAATDNLIRAIDIDTGKTVWQDTLPAGGQANPMVYEAGGRQYLVIVAAGHHFMETPEGDYVIAYALGGGS